MRTLRYSAAIGVLIIGLAVSFFGCGHGDDADPFTTEVVGSEPLTFDGPPTISTARYSKYAVEGVAHDLLETSSSVIKTMGFDTSLFPSISTSAKGLRTGGLSIKDVVIHGNDASGNPASAVGTVLSVKNYTGHCAIFTTLNINYGSYVLNPYVSVRGEGRAKIILSSLACRFYRNIHADVVLTGDFAITTHDADSGDQRFNELLFEADYDIDEGTSLTIKSATVSTDEGLLYCYDYEGSTECTSADLRPAMAAGMCSASGFAYRECDPSEETFFNSSYLLYEETPTPYEVSVVCTDYGMWSPPCALDGDFDICPQGTSCRASDSVDWGRGLEEYGVCMCSDL